MTNAQDELGQLCLQVHPAQAPRLNVNGLKGAGTLLARSIEGVHGIEFNEGEDGGPYLSIVFSARDPLRSWSFVRQGLFESAAFGPLLKTASMAMCTGADGWNDYLLLYHYDPSVPCSAASEA